MWRITNRTSSGGLPSRYVRAKAAEVGPDPHDDVGTGPIRCLDREAERRLELLRGVALRTIPQEDRAVRVRSVGHVGNAVRPRREPVGHVSRGASARAGVLDLD